MVVIMPYYSLRLATVLCLLILLVAVWGCSRVSLVYHFADSLIETYAKDYLGLDDSQIASWQPQLELALADHRREDLPYLARFFDDAHEVAMTGFDLQRTNCLSNQLEDLYRRHMRTAVDLAAPLLVELTPTQIRDLEDKFLEERAEDQVEMQPTNVARREHKRAERYQEAIDWWIGSLNAQQKAIVREQTTAIPDTAAEWIAYRTAQRNRLIVLLEQRASEAEIRSFLDAWLVEHRELPADLRRARKLIEERISELLVRIDNTLSVKQRAHFTDRLASLRDDFLSPQQRPRMASPSCTAATDG